MDTEIIPKSDTKKETHIIIVEGFQLHTYKPLTDNCTKITLFPSHRQNAKREGTQATTHQIYPVCANFKHNNPCTHSARATKCPCRHSFQG